MYRWQGLDEVPAGWGESVVTIGEFDGVHRGHQRIVARAAEMAASGASRWWRSPSTRIPDEVIRPGSHPPFLCSARRRAELLAGLGVDAVCVLPFTLEFSRLDPDEFVRTVLVEKLHAAAVVVGEDFRFGHKASGRRAAARQAGREVRLHRGRAAAARARRRDDLLHGHQAAARRRRRGGGGEGCSAARTASRAWSSAVTSAAASSASRPPTSSRRRTPRSPPTASTRAGSPPWTRPATETSRWPAAISIGTNPTFDGQVRTVEAYALDRTDLDLYGLHAAIDFAVRLRGTLRFDSVEALVEQMQLDVDQAREICAASARSRPGQSRSGIDRLSLGGQSRLPARGIVKRYR